MCTKTSANSTFSLSQSVKMICHVISVYDVLLFFFAIEAPFSNHFLHLYQSNWHLYPFDDVWVISNASTFSYFHSV